jgi:hypothetical protein
MVKSFSIGLGKTGVIATKHLDGPVTMKSSKIAQCVTVRVRSRDELKDESYS